MFADVASDHFGRFVNNFHISGQGMGLLYPRRMGRG
jgi:hypothetical protein